METNQAPATSVKWPNMAYIVSQQHIGHADLVAAWKKASTRAYKWRENILFITIK